MSQAPPNVVGVNRTDADLEEGHYFAR